ncbi:MAG: hypothetical protein K8W52_32315 [Deltaproteobacteria bacterium]|nr:hypothetical protein [Deltaproteobacteria bacterium]
MKRLAALALALAACGTFEDPAIVIDLRILATTAQPPEQLIPIDPNNPPDPSTLTLAPVELCSLIAEPGIDRPLEWQMIACPPSNDGRCQDGDPTVIVGGGMIEDPETAPVPQMACGRLEGGAPTLLVLKNTIENDPLAGFDHVDIQVSIRVQPSGVPADQAIWGTKAVRYGAQVPAERTPNQNPTLTRIDADVGETGASVPLTLGRCADQATPLTVAPGTRIKLLPVEPPSAREDYLVPTFSGGVRMLHENLSYQWLAGAGSYTRGSSGGPKDGVGNEPELDSTFVAPTSDVVGAGLDVPLWVVQRDERLGLAWYESCVRVAP